MQLSELHISCESFADFGLIDYLKQNQLQAVRLLTFATSAR